MDIVRVIVAHSDTRADCHTGHKRAYGKWALCSTVLLPISRGGDIIRVREARITYPTECILCNNSGCAAIVESKQPRLIFS